MDSERELLRLARQVMDEKETVGFATGDEELNVRIVVTTIRQPEQTKPIVSHG